VSTSVLAVVLLAALLHASWNLLARTPALGADGPLWVATGASLASLAVVAATPAPWRASWGWLAISAVLHTGYFAILTAAYRASDFGPAYTLMRGGAPLVVSLVTALFVERLALATWAGVVVLAAGIVWMAALAAPGRGRGTRGRSVALALLCALVIAAYTVVDGLGVRASGHALAYTAWVLFLDGVPLALVLPRSARAAGRALALRRAGLGLAGGAATLVSYGLVLWSMTRAPIAAVSALRETSVVFATLLATFRLREPLGVRRVAAALVVAAGIALQRLAG
jgi:drug/metabolite transporter (DMT)-like permease